MVTSSRQFAGDDSSQFYERKSCGINVRLSDSDISTCINISKFAISQTFHFRTCNTDDETHHSQKMFSIKKNEIKITKSRFFDLAHRYRIAINLWYSSICWSYTLGCLFCRFNLFPALCVHRANKFSVLGMCMLHTYAQRSQIRRHTFNSASWISLRLSNSDYAQKSLKLK